jgi:hypothetical protein
MGKNRLSAPRPFDRRTVRLSGAVTGHQLNNPCRLGPNHKIRVSPWRGVAALSNLRLALRHRHPSPGRATLCGTLTGDDRPSRHPVLRSAAHHNPGRARVNVARCRSGLAMSLLRDARSSVRPRAGHLPDADATCVAA